MTDESSATPDEHQTLAAALLAAQKDMPAIERDQENPHFKSKFTSLDNLLAKTKPVLNRHGIVLTQAPDFVDGRLALRTILTHASTGEKMDFAAPLSPSKDDPQGHGSAITYMRRYSAAAVLAIADQEDDDGDRMSQPSRSEQPKLDDAEAKKLGDEIRQVRDDIRAIDPDALPEQTFDNAISQREHSHARLRDFLGNLTEMLTDVERFANLCAEAPARLGEDKAKKAIEKAQRRASRRERVESLQKALDEQAGGGDDGE